MQKQELEILLFSKLRPKLPAVRKDLIVNLLKTLTTLLDLSTTSL